MRVVRVAVVALIVGALNVVIGDTVGARGGTVGVRVLVPKQRKWGYKSELIKCLMILPSPGTKKV